MIVPRLEGSHVVAGIHNNVHSRYESCFGRNDPSLVAHLMLLLFFLQKGLAFPRTAVEADLNHPERVEAVCKIQTGN